MLWYSLKLLNLDDCWPKGESKRTAGDFIAELLLEFIVVEIDGGGVLKVTGDGWSIGLSKRVEIN